MRKILFAVLLVGACASPTRSTSNVAKHHNIPFSFVGQENTIYFLCATQPRFYEGHLEEDHYAQSTPCPTTPID